MPRHGSALPLKQGHALRRAVTGSPIGVNEPEFDPPFECLDPVRVGAPILVSSPHSGTAFPPSFLDQTHLAPQDLLRSADLYMDQMVRGAVHLGLPVMHALFPRAFLDVNREPYELDPKMFDRRPPSFANTRSLRVGSGYGTVPRLVADGMEIYPGKIALAEALRRIDSYYLPYHARLRHQLNELHRDFGVAMLIDCHSMPSASLTGSQSGCDIVLGDRHATSCAPELIDAVESKMRDFGLKIARNQPYAGGFITEHYGNPVSGTHALQIEINRALYMNETTYQPHQGLAAISLMLMQVFEMLMDLHLPQVPSVVPLAAE